MIVKNVKNDRIYKNYNNTIANAIMEAVELAENAPMKLHVEIYMKKNGEVIISDLLEKYTCRIDGDEVEIYNVSRWANYSNNVYLPDYNISVTKVQRYFMDLYEKIDEHNVVYNYLYPQNE